MKFFTPFVDLLFYGNFWIAITAAAMVLQTQFLLTGNFFFSPFVGFVFFGTHFLYAIHRIVGLDKVQPFQNQGRYFVIAQFQQHILFYATASAITGFVLFWYLPIRWNWMLFVPAFLSFAYVLPFLGKKRRLRDFAFIKIFLIAVVWAWVTVVLTAKEEALPMTSELVYMFLERALFVFGITLPFDIRDLEIDRYTHVKTLPAILGIKKTQVLAGLTFALMLLFSWLNYQAGYYTFWNFLALSISAISSFLIVYHASKIKHDYYFTGLIDGTMLIQFLLVWGFSQHF